MNFKEALKDLFKNWKSQSPEYKNKYKSYKSKYLKSLKDNKAEPIGEGKMREILIQAGYKEDWSKVS